MAPSSKLSLHYLRKMAIYVRTRDGCFPVLGWPMWRHIACGKLQLPEDLAWLYFETFDLLIGHTSEERLEWAECLSQCSSKSELDQQRNKVKTMSGLEYNLGKDYMCKWLNLPKNVMLSLDSFMRVWCSLCCCVLLQAVVDVTLLLNLSRSYTLTSALCFFFHSSCLWTHCSSSSSSTSSS